MIFDNTENNNTKNVKVESRNSPYRTTQTSISNVISIVPIIGMLTISA